MPIQPFSTSDDLHLLKQEIEIFNSELKLMKDSVWLSSEENRLTKRHASIAIALENKEQADTALNMKLCIAGLWLKTEKYTFSSLQTQCQNCQKWGHSTRICRAQSTCQICAEKHATYNHKCDTCKISGKECPHSKTKCANCKEEHMANSSLCEFSKQQKSKTRNQNSQNTHTNMQTKSSQLVGVVILNAAQW